MELLRCDHYINNTKTSAQRRVQVVTLLLKHNANVNYSTKYDPYPASLFFVKNLVIAKILLAHGADIAAKNDDDETAAQCASSPATKDLFTKWEQIQNFKKESKNSLRSLVLAFAQEQELCKNDARFINEIRSQQYLPDNIRPLLPKKTNDDTKPPVVNAQEDDVGSKSQNNLAATLN